MMPLAMANVGDVNIIRKITGRDEVRQRLAELGFVVGGAGHGGKRAGRQPDPEREGKPRRSGQNDGHAHHGLNAKRRRKPQ